MPAAGHEPAEEARGRGGLVEVERLRIVGASESENVVARHDPGPAREAASRAEVVEKQKHEVHLRTKCGLGIANMGNCPYFCGMVPVDCNCAALRQAARFVSRLYDEALVPVGLGINQYSVLVRLQRLGPLVMQDLARALVMDRSTLGHLLRPLEKRGLVRLATCADARCRMVSLTPDGEALLIAARPLWTSAQAAFEQQFGSVEAATLREALTAVVTAPAAASVTPATRHD